MELVTAVILKIAAGALAVAGTIVLIWEVYLLDHDTNHDYDHDHDPDRD